jgi:ferric-dicitrate binding protein FerR (iron transport regulator)
MSSEQKERFKYLFQKYKDKSISPGEYLELFEKIADKDLKNEIQKAMENQQNIADSTVEIIGVDWDAMYSNITENNSNTKTKVFPVKRFLAAAAILVFISSGIFLYTKGNLETQKTVNTVIKNDVEPAQNKATLILADGSTLVLNDQNDGVLAKQGNVAVTKTKNGELIYKAGTAESTSLLYNTISTPRGGKYHVVLPDGSNVWLNVASSLKFPTAFIGTERVVELIGEAYFEIEPNKAKPFLVKTKTAQIKVLGTHFNIMEHANEGFTQTTLLEGSIAYSSKNYQQVLVPGQQAILNESLGTVKILKVNASHSIAWKNGLFIFNNTNIEEILKDLSRWYDVDIEYADDLSDVKFTGVMPRDVKVSKVLRILADAGGITFGINGKVITCSKKK